MGVKGGHLKSCKIESINRSKKIYALTRNIAADLQSLFASPRSWEFSFRGFLDLTPHLFREECEECFPHWGIEVSFYALGFCGEVGSSQRLVGCHVTHVEFNV